MSMHREISYQIREGVYHQVSRHRYLIYQEQEGVFHQISRHREITYQTRELKKCFISFPGK